ncbi:ankyrin repeat domain-containing protein [Legionella sp. 16cNR16C]|uniref:ankyrin repeat domain-containing protein n=1 Tax=Legionella sp. 16cNR16C TaxID=2905656 RepID=UPI001E437077|nr:ankyrin repeat domain-containing protein [Legionella sp. 16cNR16C]MCE3045714.1 ankyrin repeat domain-containing protein [Legionella sp. 16cNR16C]
MAIAHPNLLKLAMELGLCKDPNGLCHGFTIQWIEACLSSDEEQLRLEKYIAEIAASSPEALAAEIREAKLKSDNNQFLSESERERLEIYKLVRRISIFNAPHDFPELFNTGYRVIQRHFEAVSSLVSTDAIQEQGGLQELYSASFVLNPEEIKAYLADLDDLLELKEFSEKLTKPVALLLANANHAIGLIYKPNQGWSYRDINQDFPTGDPVVNDPAVLADFINKAYKNSSPYIAFNTRIIRTASAQANSILKDKLNRFKNSHVIDQEMAHRQEETANLVWTAAKNGDTELISQLAGYSPNLDFHGIMGMTPACMAAQNAYPEIISELITQGADINLPNNNGATPVYIAAEQGQFSVLKVLAPKANLHKTTNEEGIFPLFIAAQKGFFDIVSLLITHQANPNQRNEKGATSLIIASQMGHRDIVQHLIGLDDLDLNAAGSDKATAVYVAAQNGHDQIVRLLGEKKANLNQARDNGDTPAIIAVKNKHPAVIRELGVHGAHLNQENSEGLTPCLIAVEQRDSAMIRELSAQKADLNATNSCQMFPIFLAAQMGFSEIVDILAEEGANLDQIAYNGATPAMVAAFEGHTETVKALIAHKANFDVSTTDGITPLFMACQQNFPEIVKLLLDIPVDSTIAFRATPAQLRQSIADKGVSAIQKMESLITAQSPDSEGKIKLLPKDIAEILGHQAIVDLFIQSAKLETEAFFSDARCFFNQPFSRAASLEPALSSPEQSMTL